MRVGVCVYACVQLKGRRRKKKIYTKCRWPYKVTGGTHFFKNCKTLFLLLKRKLVPLHSFSATGGKKPESYTVWTREKKLFGHLFQPCAYSQTYTANVLFCKKNPAISLKRQKKTCHWNQILVNVIDLSVHWSFISGVSYVFCSWKLYFIGRPQSKLSFRPSSQRHFQTQHCDIDYDWDISIIWQF